MSRVVARTGGSKFGEYENFRIYETPVRTAITTPPQPNAHTTPPPTHIHVRRATKLSTGYNAPDKTEVLPGVHLVASLLKRWLSGTMHFAVTERHMDYYLDEFTFRFNRRNSKARGMLFYRLLQQAVNTDPHPLTELIHGKSGT